MANWRTAILSRRLWLKRRRRIPCFPRRCSYLSPCFVGCAIALRPYDWPMTAGCYGNDEDAAYFFDNIEAGVTYVNRPQGATTGAWPGYQPFGGWKGSGSSGKGIASFYYLAQYQREQSQTKVE